MVDLSIGFHGGSFQFANRKRLPGRVFATEGPFLIPTPPWLDHRPTQSWSMLRIKHEYWSLWTIYGCIYIYAIHIYIWYIYIYHIYIYIYHTTVISYKLLSIHQYGWLTINYWSLLSIDYFDHLSLGLAALKGAVQPHPKSLNPLGILFIMAHHCGSPLFKTSSQLGWECLIISDVEANKKWTKYTVLA